MLKGQYWGLQIVYVNSEVLGFSGFLKYKFKPDE